MNFNMRRLNSRPCAGSIELFFCASINFQRAEPVNIFYLDALNYRSRDFKCLGATSCWLLSTFFDKPTDANHILGYHNSWNLCGGVFKDNIAISTGNLKPLHNLLLIRRFKCVLKACRLDSELPILWIIASKANEQCCALHRCMLNKFPDLPQLIF